jgi:RimJ/RimL family protein N-acetyltransferase
LRCRWEHIVRLEDFAEFHLPALERDEVRHNLIIGLLGRLMTAQHGELRLWTLGAPGECAMQTPPGRPIILGELQRAQCRAFAEQTLDVDYPGVVGLDPIVPWFVERAAERGVKFDEPLSMQIQALRERPIHPGIPGSARKVNIIDIDVFATWLIAFFKEAAPYDPLPSREAFEKTAAGGNYWFWIVDGEPMALAGIVRRTHHVAAIAGVYTPPALRRRGYGAAVTAAVVDAVFAEGRTAACLYADLRNPASNRCYAKIGFKPVCRAWHYPRKQRHVE